MRWRAATRGEVVGLDRRGDRSRRTTARGEAAERRRGVVRERDKEREGGRVREAHRRGGGHRRWARGHGVVGGVCSDELDGIRAGEKCGGVGNRVARGEMWVKFRATI